MSKKTYHRSWEYAKEGDYHRELDPNLCWAPTYFKKMKLVRQFLDKLPPNTRILDAGCGEGILVEEYHNKGYWIKGIDLNYESCYVQQGNILDMPYKAETFDVIILLDVLEHITLIEQPQVLKELYRVLKQGGQLIIAMPNLAHLNSRVRFLLKGNLHRTDCIENHIGDRPLAETIHLINQSGFRIKQMVGITLTVPFFYTRLICRWPAKLRWLHDLLDIFAKPSLSMVALIFSEKKGMYKYG